MYSLGSSRETEPNAHDNLSIQSEIRKSHKVVSAVSVLSTMFTRNTAFINDFQPLCLPSYSPLLFLFSLFLLGRTPILCKLTLFIFVWVPFSWFPGEISHIHPSNSPIWFNSVSNLLFTYPTEVLNVKSLTLISLQSSTVFLALPSHSCGCSALFDLVESHIFYFLHLYISIGGCWSSFEGWPAFYFVCF